MIEPLQISLLDYEEMENAGGRILTPLRESGQLNEGIGIAVQLLEQDLLYLQEAQRKSRTNAYTEQLSTKDYERDTLFKRLKGFISLYMDDTDPKLNQGAKLLVKLITNRGWNLEEENYAVQSSLLDQLFKDLDTPAAREALEQTGALQWLSRLKKSEADFKELIKKRDSAEAGQDNPLLSEAERRFRRHVTTLFRMLEMFEEVEPQRYGPLNSTISAINVDIRAKARGRKTREEKKKE